MTCAKILLVGCGNMAGAMLDGWLAGGLAPGRFGVFDPAPRTLAAGVVREEVLPAAGVYDTILLGVKPQLLGAVASLVEPLAGPDTAVLSLLAGVDLATLEARFPRARAVVRVMPNLAAALGKSPVALASASEDAALRGAITDLMMPLGLPEWVDERALDAVTALVGSGPGFIYRFIDALAAGGAALGLDPAQAQRFATAMVEGAAMLAAGSPETPAALAQRVASPGGTTERGLAVLDEGGALAVLVEHCLRAARDRGRELAEAAREGN